jgi:hypothetical protein
MVIYEVTTAGAGTVAALSLRAALLAAGARRWSSCPVRVAGGAWVWLSDDEQALIVERWT